MKYKKFKYQNSDYHMLLFFLILLCCGIMMGIFLSRYIDMGDTNNMNSYLSVLIDKANPNQYFISQFMIGTLTIILVVLLGTSLCGFPLISFLIYTKGVQIGFSCVLFIFTYSFKGILGILMVLLPQLILDILSFYFIAHHCLFSSMNLVHTSITTSTIPIKQYCNKLLNVVILCFLLVVVSSYFKSTIGIELIKLFENL